MLLIPVDDLTTYFRVPKKLWGFVYQWTLRVCSSSPVIAEAGESEAVNTMQLNKKKIKKKEVTERLGKRYKKETINR